MKRLPLAAVLLLATPLAAQDRYLAANVAVHTVGAVTRALVEHKDPLRAAVGGCAGGAVSYAGMRMGTGGQAVVIIGANITRLSVGDDVAIPVYPLYLRFAPFRVQVSAANVAALAEAFAFGGGRLDVGRTLLVGAPVLWVRDGYLRDRGLDGEMRWGAILLERPDILAHEVRHLRQHYRDALLHALPVADAWPGWLAVDLALPLWYAQRVGGRWYEVEAEAMLRH